MAGYERAVCRVCGSEFRYSQKTAPEACGNLECRARRHWTVGEWEGYANLADAARNAGRVLTPLQIEALRRHPAPSGVFRAAGPPVPVAGAVGTVAVESRPTRDHTGPARRDWDE